MPQLPPVAAAAFVLCLLAVIVVMTVAVQVRSRKRRTRLAQIVRATAPTARPAASTAEQPLEAVLAPLRGQSYRAAEREGRFVAFEERPAREPAPGRPARRLAAQMAYAAAAESPAPGAVPEPASEQPVPAVVDSEAMVSIVSGPVVIEPEPSIHVGATFEAAAEPETPSPSASHTGLTEMAWEADAPLQPISEAEALQAAPVPPPSAETRYVDEPEQRESPAEEPLAAVIRSVVEELDEGEPASVATPRHRPEVTVLPPGPPVPALPALMTRELTLGDAGRALRGALTMTDGRQIRRAVALGAATSVVAAAFMVRGRRRSI